MKLFLLQQDAVRYFVADVATMDEATAVVQELDEQFARWERAGFPANPVPALLAHYEGADVILTLVDDRGQVQTQVLADTGWEPLFTITDTGLELL